MLPTTCCLPGGLAAKRFCGGLDFKSSRKRPVFFPNPCSPNCLLLGHGRCVLRCGCSLLSIGVQRISLLALRSQNRRCSMGKLIQRPVGSSSSKLRLDAQRAQRTGGGGPRSTSRGSASNAPTCTAGSAGRLCAARKNCKNDADDETRREWGIVVASIENQQALTE